MQGETQEAQTERPGRPADGRCDKCGGRTEPLWLGGALSRWVGPFDLCETCGADLEREQEAGRARVELLGQANLPPAAQGWDFGAAYERARLAKPDPAEFELWRLPAERCRLWPGGRRGLYLHGPEGTGKTVLAWCVVRAWAEGKRQAALFVTARELLGGRGDWLGHALSAPLLVVDDLGRVRLRKRERDVLFRVLDGRINARRPVIITANHAPASEALHRALGGNRAAPEYLISRITANTEPVELQGRSFRALEGARLWA